MEDDLSGLRSHKYFSKAIEAALSNPYRNELPSLHGAVLVKGSSILAIEYNKPKRNGFVDAYKHHAHANMHAEASTIHVSRNVTDLKGSKLYVARIRKLDEKISNSRPCLFCARVMKSYGIKRAYFSMSETSYGVLRPRDFEFYEGGKRVRKT